MNFGKNKKEEKFYFTYPQEENADWDYARNKFFLLKRAQGCWSSSIFSVNVGDYLLPNRDYPHQGLLCKVDGTYTKFIDAVMFKLQDGDGTVDLNPTKVEVSPWKVIYFYNSEEVELKVEYFIPKTQEKNKLGACVKFNINSTNEKNWKLIVSPLVDIRGLKEESEKDHKLQENDENLKITKGNKEILFGPVEDFQEEREELDWKYKLDSGERKIEENKVFFKEENKTPSTLGKFTYKLKNELKLGIVCGKEVDKEDLNLVLSKDEKEDIKQSEDILEKFSLDAGGLEEKFYRPRILTLEKFSTWENNLKIPEAGEWWFKQVWFRDLFESILHNMEFYRKVKGDEWLEKVFNWAGMFLKEGVMANKPMKNNISYSSLDASFLYLIAMSEFYEKAGDKEFRKKIMKMFESVMGSFDDKEELISCKANYSWLDSKFKGKSTRIPAEWEVDKKEEFLLPEVNALWIKAMEKYNKICGREVKIKKLWEKWRETFWNEDKEFPYQIVYRKNGKELKDETESSVGITSVAILMDHFYGNEILEAWKTAKEKLLVKRMPAFFEKKEMPFGLIVKNTNKKVYLNDEQYHEAVIWPRDIPYLFKILRKLGKESIIRDICLNLLDHQMSEGAIFYNHELFSLPEGNNPSEEMALSGNPVPVKNPAQLWSHFLLPLKRSKQNS